MIHCDVQCSLKKIRVIFFVFFANFLFAQLKEPERDARRISVYSVKVGFASCFWLASNSFILFCVPLCVHPFCRRQKKNRKQQNCNKKLVKYFNVNSRNFAYIDTTTIMAKTMAKKKSKYFENLFLLLCLSARCPFTEAIICVFIRRVRNQLRRDTFIPVLHHLALKASSLYLFREVSAFFFTSIYFFQANVKNVKEKRNSRIQNISL